MFCHADGKLTKEHVWAAWLRPYMPDDLGTTQTALTLRRLDPDTIGIGVDLRTIQHEHYGDRVLGLVCKACNNGWMSRMQDDVKSSLLSLIDSSASTVSNQDVEALCRWVVMTTMVAEFTDMNPLGRGISSDERQAFSLNLETPCGWEILVGRAARDGPRVAYDHFSVVLKSEKQEPSPPTHNTQATLMILGDLLIYAFSSPVRNALKRLLKRQGMCQQSFSKMVSLYPLRSTMQWQTMTPLQLDDLANLQMFLKAASVAQ